MNVKIAASTAFPDRAIFLVAGCFNMAVALGLAFPGSPAWRLIGLAPPEQQLFLHLFLVFVVLFGLAYFWIGSDIAGKRPLIVLGIAGKTAVVATIAAYYLTGVVPLALVVLASGDILFAFLFFRVLRRLPK